MVGSECAACACQFGVGDRTKWRCRTDGTSKAKQSKARERERQKKHERSKRFNVKAKNCCIHSFALMQCEPLYSSVKNMHCARVRQINSTNSVRVSRKHGRIEFITENWEELGCSGTKQHKCLREDLANACSILPNSDIKRSWVILFFLLFCCANCCPLSLHLTQRRASDENEF